MIIDFISQWFILLTIRATIDFAVLKESAEVNGTGVVGQPTHLDDGGVISH